MHFEFLITLYFIAMIVIVVYFLTISTFNMIDMKKNTIAPPSQKTEPGVLVSVLIPARNEEQHIEKCLESLRDQDYTNYEILVIDDNSTDKTFEVVNKIALEDSRVKVFKSQPLPDDWFGKPFALQQLSEHARGDLFLFTDADTRHSRKSISWAVANINQTGADFLSGYVGQILKTFGERVTVPVMFFLTGFIIPIFLGKYLKFGYFSAAVGQYIVVRRKAFLEVKGFEPVKKKTSEDVYIARYFKSKGYKTEFLDITNYVSCRMYEGYFASVKGIGKNIYDFLGKKLIAIFLVASAVLLFFTLPFPLLIYFAASGITAHLAELVIANVMFTVAWLLLFTGRNISWYNAFLWPILYCNLFIMIVWSFFRTVSGKGFTWKDRVVR